MEEAGPHGEVCDEYPQGSFLKKFLLKELGCGQALV